MSFGARCPSPASYDDPVRISAKVDYAVRAMCELAAHPGDKPLKAEQIATAQEIPLSYLENILVDLRRAGLRPLAARSGWRLPDGQACVDGHRSPTSSGPWRARSRTSAGIRPEAIEFIGIRNSAARRLAGDAGEPAQGARAGLHRRRRGRRRSRPMSQRFSRTRTRSSRTEPRPASATRPAA